MLLNTRFHECLAKQQPSFGAFLYLNSVESGEWVAKSWGVDWWVVDVQHSAMGLPGSLHLLRGVQSVNPALTPMARLPGQEPFWIEQFLDAGYLGLIIPQVESAEQARALARKAYLPPQGERSWNGSVRCMIYDQYTQQINDRMILLPQIESRGGLDNCEAIINTPGVTGVMVGPSDLSLSMGWAMADQWKSDVFLAAMKRIGKACRDAGKIAMTPVPNPQLGRVAIEHGFKFLIVGGDAVSVRLDGAQKLTRELAEMRG